MLFSSSSVRSCSLTPIALPLLFLLFSRLSFSLPLLFIPTLLRHVVLPQDIAQLLPKGKLLSEVRILGRKRGG